MFLLAETERERERVCAYKRVSDHKTDSEKTPKAEKRNTETESERPRAYLLQMYLHMYIYVLVSLCV